LNSQLGTKSYFVVGKSGKQTVINSSKPLLTPNN